MSTDNSLAQAAALLESESDPSPPEPEAPSSNVRSKPPPLPESASRRSLERVLADEAFADRMLERLASGDYLGALISAVALLETHPLHQDALDTAQIARTELRRLYIARLGSLEQVPHLAVGPGALFSMQLLDFRAGLVLSRVDGRSTLGEIADACGMPEHDALRILSELYLHRVIALDEEPPQIPA